MYRTIFLVFMYIAFSQQKAAGQGILDIQVGQSILNFNSYPVALQDAWEGSRAQYLFRATDLHSWGITKGIIYGIKFNVTFSSGIPAGVTEQYTIKIGTTTATTMPQTSWLGGTNTVWGPLDYQSVQGSNVFTFSTPFNWNGTDNIVLETCNGDPNNSTSITYTKNGRTSCSQVNYICTHTYVRDDLGNLCGTTNTFQMDYNNLRPNTIFTWESTDSCLPVQVPYYENFETAPEVYLPICTSRENFTSSIYEWMIKNDNFNPGINNKYISYLTFDNSAASNAYFYTRGIFLTAGTSYNLSFKYAQTSNPSSYVDKMNVFYGTTPTADSMVYQIVDIPTINNFTALNSSTDFVPATSGVYYIGFHAYSDPYQQGIAVDDIALTLSTTTPVKLLSFTGKRIAENTNRLNWTTANEQNNKGFVIQRSADGENFNSMGFVGSKAPGGSSTANLNYSFTDGNPFSGTTYYRLKQVDFDGKSTLSNVVMIKGVKNTKLTITGLYPNPVEHDFTLLVVSHTNNEVSIVITDIAGKIVKQIPYALVSGDNRIPMKVEELSKGTYVLKVVCSNGCEKAVSKFVKM